MEQRSVEVVELRQARRFTITLPLVASFFGVSLRVVNVSAGGMQLEHREPIRLGTRSQLRLSVPSTGEAVAIPARIVWSHLSSSADGYGKFLYRSGLAIDDDSIEIAGSLGRLIRACGAPDTGSLERKRAALEQKLNGTGGGSIVPPARKLTPDQLLLIQNARDFLVANPDEAQKWYNRAKFSIAEKATGHDRTLPYRHDVLAIWEYLGGKIDLPVIAIAFNLMK